MIDTKRNTHLARSKGNIFIKGTKQIMSSAKDICSPDQVVSKIFNMEVDICSLSHLSLDGKKCINLSYTGMLPSIVTTMDYEIKTFPCGEIEFSLNEDFSSEDVVIFQSFEVGKFNDGLILLQLVCGCLNRNNVKSITLVAPFLPYTRQDRSHNCKTSLGFKIVADIINSCRISHTITLDLHSPQTECLFKFKLQNLSLVPLFISHIRQNFTTEEICIVFPDSGSASRFKHFFEDETFEIAILSKTRSKNEIKMKALGNVSEKSCIIIDDMIDGGGTIIEAANTLVKNGARQIFAYATHGLFSNNAKEKIAKSPIVQITTGQHLVNQTTLN